MSGYEMMNLDANQRDAYITAPDDSAKTAHEALPPSAQPNVVMPGPTDDQPATPLGGKSARSHDRNLYGMPLAWRGLQLLGVAIGIAGVWFVAAWIRHGRMPLGEVFPQKIRISIGHPPQPILPPDWLLAIVGLMVLVSLAMVLVGTQDANWKLRARKPAKST